MTKATHRNEDRGTGRWRAYSDYKDSGVEWLGDIPSHWAVKRLKTLASVRLSNVDKKSRDGEVPVKLCNYVDVYYNESITARLDFMEATATPDQVRRFRLQTGDVVITKDSESWDDIAVPAVVAEEATGVLCGYHLALIRPRAGVHGEFLARAFSAIGPRDHFHLAANGITRFGLGGDAIRTGLFPLAPREEEQRAIADFLDRETARIDELVAKKEELIELLREKRTVLITRATTRGLDPNAPLRDSGIEWLGDIPAHWNVRRLKLLLQEPLHYGANEPAQLLDPDLPRYIRITDIDDHGRLRDDTFRSIPEEAAEPHLLREGDLLFARSGATVGKTTLFEASWGRAAHAGYLVRARLEPRDCDARFVRYFTISSAYRHWLRSSFIQATIQNVSAERYGNMELPLPTPSEQRAIVHFLDGETAKAGALVAKVRQAIAHLQELRTALISAAVTGRIDVREATPR